MNKTELAELARKAGFEVSEITGAIRSPSPLCGTELKRFAALVAAAALAEPVQEPVADKMEEAHDWQYRITGERLRRIEKLEAQRDALLEALKALVEASDSDEWNGISTMKARAAIKAVEEGK